MSFEDRVRELCARAVTAHGTEATGMLNELKATLHQHAEHTRAWLLSSYPLMSSELFKSVIRGNRRPRESAMSQ